MTAYRRGVRLEYLARDELRRQGYTVVRSAGSHGSIDLITLNDHEVLIIQVKKYGQPIRPALRKLLAVPCPPDTRRQAWVYHPARGRAPARWQVVEGHAGD